MSTERKPHADPVARIETAGFDRLVPPYGGSLEELPAAFWATFAESLAVPSGEDTLDGDERLLIESAREVAYHCGHRVTTSWPWAPFITPLDSPDATADDVLNATFATLAALGVDRCRLVELVPFERLVLRVRVAGGGGAQTGARSSGRREELAVRGFCAGIMELAYGGAYDEAGPGGSFECRRSMAPEAGEGVELVISRRERER